MPCDSELPSEYRKQPDSPCIPTYRAADLHPPPDNHCHSAQPRATADAARMSNRLRHFQSQARDEVLGVSPLGNSSVIVSASRREWNTERPVGVVRSFVREITIPAAGSVRCIRDRWASVSMVGCVSRGVSRLGAFPTRHWFFHSRHAVWMSLAR